MKFVQLLLATAIFFSLNGMVDNAHFYRANFFWGEPGFERPWLSSFNFYISGGSATQGRNCNGDCTGILTIYGTENIHRLAENVPTLDPNSPLDALLINLNKQPDNGTFGQLQYSGEFTIDEAIFDIQQNINHGLFFQYNMPVRSFRISSVNNADLSPLAGPAPNSTNAQWRAVLNSFEAILKKFNLHASNIKEHGVGDITLLVGMSTNYEKTTYIDFIDATGKIGILLPTGKEKNENRVFDLPTGYNKHWGFPLSFDLSIGLWEWLTIGFNSGALFLIDSQKNIRMKTSCNQNGAIKLTKGLATVRPGIVWHVGAFLKIDHFADFFSFIFAYSFNKKNDDQLIAQNPSLFPSTIINSDELLKSWNMHTCNCIFEFDFSKEGRRYHPNINFFINLPVAGKRIFSTNTGGLNAGLTVQWHH